ncbi:UPF0175 family protein [bacterium]|nr:UPF0175 family protein [bacterium]MBU1614167.1 UPF0175 family protein [bacterium]
MPNVANFVDWEINQLVKAELYPDKNAVIRNAVRALFQVQPESKLKMIITAYQSGEISIGKAAEIMGVSQEEMKDVFREVGVKLYLGPATVDELKKDACNA